TSVGHGTHVAGITAGLGTASGGYYTGVAPGAKLIGLGTGDILFIFWALAGFDYILDHQQAYNIKVVNNAWGTSGPFDPKDPINKATKKVHDKGITVVFAAGNDGPDQNTLNPYSVAPWVIGVAAGCKLVTPDPTNSAVHCADQTGQNRPAWLADFSSRGIPGSSLYHPDITAPGVHIVSTRASTGTVLNALDANHDFDLTSSCAISVANEPYYTCASGTSMATPHVVGVVALMQEAADDNYDERASGDCEDVLDSAQLVPVAAPAYNRTRSESHECAPQEPANDAGRPASLAAHPGAGADVQSRPRGACKLCQCAVAATHDDGVAVDRLECACGAPVGRRDANAVAGGGGGGGGGGGRVLGGEAIHRKAEDDGERAVTDRVHRIPPHGGTRTGPKWASRPRVSEGNLRDSSS